ncbi:hypothetical protein [uncultured Thiothrix sp.]|uniref:hypothetical protein n=1 Tax=uncultured Thiothrix sp. TaxID=223185 RepID=UPI0026326E71|nr:hypothetical protein [uncultured Thiothrix sp.]
MYEKLFLDLIYSINENQKDVRSISGFYIGCYSDSSSILIKINSLNSSRKLDYFMFDFVDGKAVSIIYGNSNGGKIENMFLDKNIKFTIVNHEFYK